MMGDARAVKNAARKSAMRTIEICPMRKKRTANPARMTSTRQVMPAQVFSVGGTPKSPGAPPLSSTGAGVEAVVVEVSLMPRP